MIRPEELRLGNLVLEAGEVSTIVLLEYKYKQTYRINDVTIDARTIEDRFQGIPLTEDWLKRFGYIQREEDSKAWYHPSTINYDLRNITALQNGFKIVAGYPETDRGFFRGVNQHLQYVHQLMNFHFASTGTELALTQ